MIRLSLRLVMQPLDPPGLPRRLVDALTCSGTPYGLMRPTLIFEKLALFTPCRCPGERFVTLTLFD